MALAPGSGDAVAPQSSPSSQLADARKGVAVRQQKQGQEANNRPISLQRA